MLAWDIAKLISVFFIFNLIFALFLFAWVTDDDISNLPKDPFQRYIALLYFTITTSTTTGYGDIVPKTIRARMTSSFLQITMFAIVIKRVLEK